MLPERFPQALSLLPLELPLLPGALPPDRHATPQPASGRLRVAPPSGKGEPFPEPQPRCKMCRTTTTPVSTGSGEGQF